VSGFSPDWLALREAADARARRRDLLATLPTRYPLIVDLGAGAGANLRWLAPQLDTPQRWLLLDHDAGLLAAARQSTRDWAESRGYRPEDRAGAIALSGPGFECSVDTLEIDLKNALHELALPGGCLITASALFDLVSREWLEALVARVAASAACVLWTLSYSGAVEIEPATGDDDAIIAGLNRHQLTDKGFGPALGPEAWVVAQRLLEEAGFSVQAADSSWRLDGDDSALVRALIAGWADAAAAIAPADARAIRQWCERRLGQAAQGRLRVTVGHRDLAAHPGG